MEKNNMSPKEKALELIDKYRWISYDLDDIENHKESALIAVDEILNNFGLTANGQTFFTEHRAVKYYQEVKQEIEKL